LSVTRPLDSSPALYYKWFVVTMHLSGTVMGISRLRCWTHGGMDVDRERKMEEGKEKEEGGGKSVRSSSIM